MERKHERQVRSKKQINLSIKYPEFYSLLPSISSTLLYLLPLYQHFPLIITVLFNIKIRPLKSPFLTAHQMAINLLAIITLTIINHRHRSGRWWSCDARQLIRVRNHVVFLIHSGSTPSGHRWRCRLNGF